MKNNQRTIRVCDSCEVPMLWTFAFPGWERYCLNCGYGGGMLGTGRDVEATRERIMQFKLARAMWKVINGRKGMVTPGGYRVGCTKCRNHDEAHSRHLTKAETEWDEIARRLLKSVRGSLNLSQPSEVDD